MSKYTESQLEVRKEFRICPLMKGKESVRNNIDHPLNHYNNHYVGKNN